MRAAFRSPGVPSTSEAGTASLIAGPSNRPMRAGFAENSFLVNAVPRMHDREQSIKGARGVDISPEWGERGGIGLHAFLKTAQWAAMSVTVIFAAVRERRGG
jgi:hypothetical protein